MLTLDSISLQRGGEFLLRDASAVFNPGQHLALIGANGCGKSSLLQLILGRLDADAGDIRLPNGWRIAHMAQEVEGSERSALDYVVDGDRPLRALQSQLEKAEAQEDHQSMALLHQQLDACEGYTASVRAEQLLMGLGFAVGDTRRSVKDFSGGWRIRLNLAQALMQPADLLLLDEPTNHLDTDASLWLENYLKRFPGTLILISHDRDFIDACCEQIVHIDQCGLQTYKGNYSAFEYMRAERAAQQAQLYAKQQERIEQIQSFVNRFRAKATKARQAQSRLKELERMERLQPAYADSPFNFSFPVPERFSDPLLTLAQASLGHSAATPILVNANLSLHPNSRIGLLGRNGAGKSTLMKSLANDLALLQGERVQGEHLHIGYFSQHQLEALDMEASPALHLQRISPLATEQSIRNFLGSYNFIGEKALETIRHFSGGEKARLALAIVVWQKPNLLLLDEPTNHLDLEMRQALALALQDFKGAVVLVSHDRYLMRHTAEELLLVDDGAVTPFDGTLDDYKDWLLQKVQQASKPTVTSADESKTDKKQLRQQAAARRQILAPLTKELKRIEKQMPELQQRLAVCESALAEPDIYNPENKQRLQDILAEQSQIKPALETLEEQWLTVSEQLEEAQ